MNFVLEYDDFHPYKEVNCLETIKQFVNEVPNIKITLFTIPCYHNIPLSEADSKWLSDVKSLIESNNVRLAVHGYRHEVLEFKYYSNIETTEALNSAEHCFDEADLPFINVFRGPFWGINEHTYRGLEIFNYTHIYTHEDYRALIPKNSNVKSVFYNWNLKDDSNYIIASNDPIVAHGHTHDVCENGIDETMSKVLRFVRQNEIEFKFANEV